MDRELTCLQPISLKPDLNEVTSQICALDGIPISGYTTFQQTDYYKLYFHFKQYVINEKKFWRSTQFAAYQSLPGKYEWWAFPIHTAYKERGDVIDGEILWCLHSHCKY